MKIQKTIPPLFTAFTLSLAILIAAPSALAAPGSSQNGILNQAWQYDMYYYVWGFYGASPAIANLGADVNFQGGEPAADLESVVGSDEVGHNFPALGGAYAAGIWRTFDSQGNIEWAKDTQSDESRGDPVIIDLDGDGQLEVVGGTTSGETIEVMDRFGNFVWTFPTPPQSGNFMWDGGPAVADTDPNVTGQEIFASNRLFHEIYAFDGDNSDGVDDGITYTGTYWSGTEGTDWDILWTYQVNCNNCEIYATVTLGDIDNDGTMEVAFGATNGHFYILDSVTGAQEADINLGGAIYASAAVGNIDNDAYLEIVIGSTNNDLYVLQWDGAVATTEWSYTTGGAVYSSAAIGDIDGDGSYEIVVGSNDGSVYALSASGTVEWSYATGGAVYSSPTLAFRGGCGLGIYVGSEDTYLYMLDGSGNFIDRFETSTGGSTGYQGIHTSPSVADVDGDGKLEAFFYDWGTGSSHNGHTFWAVEDSGSNVTPYSNEWANFRRDAKRTGFYSEKPPACVPVDIKPQSCPNPVNTKSQGVLPIAIVGGPFDASQIDPSSIQLEGVSPVKWGYEDVTTPHEPYVGKEDCYDCSEAGPDGVMDMTLKFNTQEIVAAMGSVEDGQCLTLKLTGTLLDGTPIYGEDVVIVKKKGGKGATLEPLSGNGSGASVSASVNNKGGAGASGPLLLLLGLLGAIAYYIRRKNHG